MTFWKFLLFVFILCLIKRLFIHDSFIIKFAQVKFTRTKSPLQAMGTIDASHLFPDKLIIKNVGNKNEPVDRDELLNVDDKNWKSVVCRRCDSLIFPEDRVKLVDDYKAKLPLMSPGGKGCTETEEVSLWWYTNSDMDFDTVGFAWVVIDNKKTLLCGDCEFGPIGLRTLDDKQYWVAAERVAHVDKPPPPGAKPRPKKDKKKKQ